MVEPATAIRSVNVKTMAGEVRTVSLPCSSLVHHLKAKISEVFSVPVDRQRLIFQGKLLKDDIPLSSFLKEDGLTVHMMMRALDAEPAREAPAQEQQAQPSFFGMPFGDLMGDPQGFLRQVTQMVTQIVPESMQGIQVNFGAEGPLFQVLQRHGNPQPPAPPQPQPSAEVPIQAPVQAPVQPQRQPSRAEERKEGDLVLPYGHVHNMGQIINILSGPRNAISAPAIPALPFPRTPLMQLGRFLHLYQFQLLRLLPYLSRLADLLQRESLLTEASERSETQYLARDVGAALQELQAATQRVSGLFQQLDMNNPPRAEPVAASMSLRELLLATEVNLADAGTLVNGLLDCVTLNDLGELFEGKLEPLERFQPILKRHFQAAVPPNSPISLEDRRAIIGEFEKSIRCFLVQPPSPAPGLDYVAVTTDMARLLADRVLALVLDYSEADFPQVLKTETLKCIGNWANIVAGHMGSEALDPLVASQLNSLFGQSVRQSLRSLHSVAVPMAQALVQAAYHSCDRLEASWAQTIAEDQQIQAQSRSFPSLSRTYSALDPFRIARTDYESPPALLNEILTFAMQDAGVSLPAAALPEDLALAFVEMLHTDIGNRAREDGDFEENRFRYLQQVRRS